MDLDDPPVCLPDDGDADGGAVRWFWAIGGFDSDDGGVGTAWPGAVEIEGDGAGDSFALGVAIAGAATTGAVPFPVGGREVRPVPGRAFCLEIADC